jgi:hypothetical protein
MSDLKTALEVLNLPKDVLDRMERFSSTLFGPSAREFGELLADRVRFRRYQNQVRFLLKAEDLLRTADLNPRAVPLRTLLPLVEAASLEEDEGIQSMWAALLARASQHGARLVLHSACIQVLRSISPVEAHLLNQLFRIWSEREEEARSKGETYPAEKLTFRPKPLLAELEVVEEDVQLVADNLIRLGVASGTRSTELMTLTTLGLRVLQEVTTDGWQEPG